jgi:hypothetical protein
VHGTAIRFSTETTGRVSALRLQSLTHIVTWNAASDWRAYNSVSILGDHPNMRTTLLGCVGLLASYWVDVIHYDGAYSRAVDVGTRNVAKAVVTVIRRSV